MRFMPSIAKKVTTAVMIDMLRARREGAKNKDLQRVYELSAATVSTWMSKYEGLDARSYLGLGHWKKTSDAYEFRSRP